MNTRILFLQLCGFLMLVAQVPARALTFTVRNTSDYDVFVNVVGNVWHYDNSKICHAEKKKPAHTRSNQYGRKKFYSVLRHLHGQETRTMTLPEHMICMAEDDGSVFLEDTTRANQPSFSLKFSYGSAATDTIRDSDEVKLYNEAIYFVRPDGSIKVAVIE